AVAENRWRAEHYGGPVPAGVSDPALPSTGGAGAEECVEGPRALPEEPDREVVQSGQAPPGWSAETAGDRHRRPVPRAECVSADVQTSRCCGDHGAADLANKRQEGLR